MVLGTEEVRKRAEITVVFDCNVYLQAIGRGGNHAFRCLQLAAEREVSLFISALVLAELRDVLHRPLVRGMFPMLDDAKIEDLLAWVTDTATLVDPVPHRFDYPLDPKDEPYIDLAIESGAAFLVSWDKHVIRLSHPNDPYGKQLAKQYPELRVVDPRQFLEFYFKK